MDLSEEEAHAFIVRIWREPREIDDAASEWRGMIEHVESGERRYFRECHGGLDQRLGGGPGK